MPHTQTPADWPEYAKRLGLSIQRRRVSMNLSQEYVAYNANLSRFTYQQLEKGESRPGTPSNPSLMNVMAVAQVLDVTIDALLPEPWPDLHA
ncbi:MULTISPECIES: helix-turn-helix transcriptional regulator [Bifidobacterium]|uniref:XRE family transcriptional regulator n=1 Tax=Bifidobacterium callitrichidarum TaxID=2052941 RepID=A0A2U2N119_9BIFI|nr:MULTISPECIES: helix-turn-helix transcriptional regulator [Bifidobacterium]MBT1171419.1 helix-turn-helix transcriptional regulator [Bifidobacterium sp. SO4]PWG62757.1 XRE family transcriptional regulator [Bifidobacterium callitrichidarum]